MADPFIGEILMFGGNFAPRNWALCDGQLVSISQNSALFSILGTTYGGDGRVNFALPDMRGRVAMHAGSGPGLTPRSLGQRSGTETNTISTNHMPAHAHTINYPCNSAGASTDDPSNAYPAIAQEDIYNSVSDGTMAQGTTSSVGGGQAVNNLQPYLAVNFLIALFGTFPSRN